MTRKPLCFAVQLCLLIAACSNAAADPLLDQGLTRMATEIKKFVQSEGLPNKIVVGAFTAPPRLKASGGVEIRRAVSDALRRVGMTVSDDAELQLMGRFKLKEVKQHPSDDFESLALQVEAMILDGDDEELAELPISIFGSAPLQIAGQTVDVSPQVTERQRQATLIKHSRQPATLISGNTTKAGDQTRFGLEVFVNAHNRLSPRSPRLDSRRRSFVDLHRGEEYIVRLHNTADFEAAATLTIDGVDMFVDAQDAPKDSRLIIAPHSHIDVPGWYINQSRTKAFQIGGYEESVAKRVGQQENVGSITAVFRASWDPSGRRPKDEAGGYAKGGKATKQGRDIRKDYSTVVRDFGVIRSIITVRYDR